MGETPLHWAVKMARLDLIDILLRHGANLDLQNNYGETALDLETNMVVTTRLKSALRACHVDVHARVGGSHAHQRVCTVGGGPGCASSSPQGRLERTGVAERCRRTSRGLSARPAAAGGAVCAGGPSVARSARTARGDAAGGIVEPGAPAAHVPAAARSQQAASAIAGKGKQAMAADGTLPYLCSRYRGAHARTRWLRGPSQATLAAPSKDEPPPADDDDADDDDDDDDEPNNEPEPVKGVSPRGVTPFACVRACMCLACG